MAEDTSGNVLGPRGTFSYTTDSNEEVVFSMDRSIGLAVGNPLATTASRPTSVNSKYLSGRRVNLQGKDDPSLSKSVVISTADNTLFAADSTQEVTINGVVFVTTGRSGESVTFLRLTPAEAPPA